MDISKLIKPVNEKHSIKEAVISIFLENPIIKPERFLKLIETDYKEKFHQAEPINTIKFNIKSTKGNIERQESQVYNNTGFKFIEFEMGKIKSMLQGTNEQYRSFISYHNLKYERWKSYYEDYINTLQGLRTIQSDFYIKAYSLHYIDEFIWIEKESKIDTSKIFNNKSTYLPCKFFESSNTLYSILTDKDIDGIKYNDRIEITAWENINKTITISHNITHTINELIEFNNIFTEETFKNGIELAHKHNKTILKDLLIKEIQDLINLK